MKSRKYFKKHQKLDRVFILSVCAPSMRGACQGQEEVSDPLNLDLQAVVSPGVC